MLSKLTIFRPPYALQPIAYRHQTESCLTPVWNGRSGRHKQITRPSLGDLTKGNPILIILCAVLINPRLKFMRLSIYLISFFIVSVAYSDAVRSQIELTDAWRFVKEDVKGGQGVDYDDTSWQRLSIPHNWGYEEAEQGNRNYYRGLGWYRRDLDIYIKEENRYFIKFEAASSVADVYLNGEFIGQHRGGFSAFTYELTPFLNQEGDNVLAVRVSNEVTQDVIPLTGDFNIYGGLYRPVHIIETSSVCIDPTNHGSSGVTWLQTEVSNKRAVVDLTAWVSNGSDTFLPHTFFPPEDGGVFPDFKYRLVARLVDAGGTNVAESEKEFNLAKDSSSPYELRLTVDDPHLWQGKEDPYLYTAELELYSNTNTLIDRVENKIGLRSFHIDPDTGFYLNGKPYRLKGVSRHQDREGKGWAITEKDMRDDLSLILEMGANAVRLAHYQHSSYFHQLCDEKGILLYVEIPLVGTFQTNLLAYENAHQQLLDLIRQNINHTSIFAWGLFNELNLHGIDPVRTVYGLNKLAKSEDPTRYTIAATSNMGRPALNNITDVLGWNRYPGWYDPLEQLFDSDRWIMYKPTSRNGGMAFSEYGAGANIEHHEQNPNQPIPKSFWHPEEWQTLVHESHWACFKDKPFIWGTFIWNMFDFCSARRNEGGKININDKGLVTFDHKVKKDAYYFYKANWSDSPVLYITSKRHQIRNEPVTPIKVYSNRGAVTLSVNGKTIGTITPSDTMICLWENVELREGENHIQVNTKDQNDEVIWIYDPEAKSNNPKVNNAKRIGGDGGVGDMDL